MGGDIISIKYYLQNISASSRINIESGPLPRRSVDGRYENEGFRGGPHLSLEIAYTRTNAHRLEIADI